MYRPGDFTVTPVPDGYMVGRVIERPEGAGQWWEYIKAEPDLETALRVAKDLADREGVKAWIYDHPRAFLEITRAYLDDGSK